MEKNNQNLKSNSKNSTFYFLLSKFFAVFLFFIFYFPLSIFPASAASFSVSPQDLVSGKETEVALNINTEEREINAVELRLKFLPDDFLVKDATDGNSIINLWIEKPAFSNEKGEIYFSGIIPGGFQGASGQLLRIILIPQKTGESSFEIAEEKVLLNDGAGTEAEQGENNLRFKISETLIDPENYSETKDIDPPETFAPEIASDPNIFGGKYFLAFATQDKGSGIDHCEVLESRNQKIENRNWEIAESPYALKDQKLQSYIYVKAMDKAGNARIAMIPPEKPQAWYENYLIYAIIVAILIVLAIVIVYIFWRKLFKRI